MSKHEDIIKYILSLKVGAKISVRGIASKLGVSEGTAYTAIKDCDNLGIVSTIPRIGTVRIEKICKKSIETITYGELVNFVDGSILGGKEGIYKVLNKFVIGAMTKDVVESYLKEDCIVIVGNREDIQKLALEKGAGVLITGGFSCSDEIKEISNKKCLPIISSKFDTFTVASLINRAISESLIKKDILLVEDVMKNRPYYLRETDTIVKWRELASITGHERYPVVDENMKVVGMITTKDLNSEVTDNDFISKVMTKNPITVTLKTTVAYAAHIMVLEGIELCAVVQNKKLIGVVNRQDVIKALQYAVKQPETSQTIDDLVIKNFEQTIEAGELVLKGKIIPEMLDYIGTASWSSLNMLITSVAVQALRKKSTMNVSIDSISTYFIKPVQMDSLIDILTHIIDMGRNCCKVEVSMVNHKKELIAKAIVSAKFLRK